MSIDLAWLAGQFPDLKNLQPLNKGGQKQVFSAFHQEHGAVVLKIVNADEDPESVRREILAVTKVASSRVPAIYQHGEIDTPSGRCFWLREQQVFGETLRSKIQRGPLDPLGALRLTHQMLEALAQAERASIVHRDVKPDNIMLDANGQFWLLDFGIARHLDLNSITSSTNPWGKMTVGYAPLEQCKNLKRKIDSRSDLFALGITVIEAATKSHPFRDGARDGLEVIRRLETVSIPPLVLPIASAKSFSDLVNSMTQRRRDHRINSAVSALAWCEEIVAAQPARRES